jgi:type II secretory pathway pseudopilin PulG
MKKKRYFKSGDEGFTFIETLLTVVVMSIMILGLTIVMMAFRDHLDRSWAIRVMDQYANDVIENLSYEIRNATEVTVRSDTRVTDRIVVIRPYEYNPDLPIETLWYADLRTGQVKRDHRPIDLLYPPKRLRRGESFQIVEFKLYQYGEVENNDSFDPMERLDSQWRNENFNNATYDLKLTLVYNRGTINVGDRPWFFQKTYDNRIYMKNMNVTVKS